MTKKLLQIILISVLLAGCASKPNIPDYSKPPQEEAKPELKANQSYCQMESGMKTAQATEIRDIGNKFIDFMKTSNYELAKPYLSSDLNQQLELMGVEDKKLNVFLPNANDVLTQIQNYQIKSIFEIITSPDSTHITGSCTDKKQFDKSLFYNINNPKSEEAVIYITGYKNITFANTILLLKKFENGWKIANISIYPGAAGGKQFYELFQYAEQFKKGGKNNLAYMFYKLITDLTPKSEVVPEYIMKSYQALNELKVAMPDKAKGKYIEWNITEDYKILIYDFKPLPVQDKIALLVGYLTSTEDTQINNEESLYIKAYIEKYYPDLLSFFTLLITEATFEIPKTPNYRRYRNLLKLSKPGSTND